MICPKCNSKTVVTDSREIADGRVIRQRKCKKCNCIFYTSEEDIDYEDVAEDLRDKYRELRKRGKHERD